MCKPLRYLPFCLDNRHQLPYSLPLVPSRSFLWVLQFFLLLLPTEGNHLATPAPQMGNSLHKALWLFSPSQIHRCFQKPRAATSNTSCLDTACVFWDMLPVQCPGQKGGLGPLCSDIPNPICLSCFPSDSPLDRMLRGSECIHYLLRFSQMAGTVLRTPATPMSRTEIPFIILKGEADNTQ